MRTIKLSATSLATAKTCPMKYRLAYVLGWRPIEDSDIQRVGTRWHKGLELIGRGKDWSDWLNETYATVPTNRTAEEWATERAKLAAFLTAWAWRWQGDSVTTLATEVTFSLPLRHPGNNRIIPGVERVGKIDRLVLVDGRPMLGEYKSTSQSVASDSRIWDRYRRDTQLSEYICAARELQLRGALAPAITPSMPLISGGLYDLWHRPQSSPKLLTQADSKKLVETGEYCGQKFKIDTPPLFVDGERADGKPGAKPGTFAVRETPGMYSVRLLWEAETGAYHRPDYYFARREIARTDDELRAYEWERYHLFLHVKNMARTGKWYGNENWCDARYVCPYLGICNHCPVIHDDDPVPNGFRCIFEDEIKDTEE